MSGDFTAIVCNCPRTKGTCPHCFSTEHATFSTYMYHIDKCHRRIEALAISSRVVSTAPVKSMPQNASHQAAS